MKRVYNSSKQSQIMCEGAEERACWDFLRGPMVETLLANAGDMGSIPGKIPHAAGQLSPHTTTGESVL